MRRSVVLGAAACAVAVSVTSCSSEGVYGIPLPGGADVSDHPMHLKIQFTDVLDLVPQSTVKVDGVPVGRVESIGVPNDGWQAEVGVVLNPGVNLPANSLAAVEQTNLLGEKFIQLSPPPDGQVSQRLTDGATIPVARTTQATDIEQVLGAFSLLLNGGGVGQLQPIVHELSTALDGREGRTRDLLNQANTLIDGLNKQRGDITRALDGLDVLTDKVNGQKDKIDMVLDELPIATDVLNKQRPQLTELLSQLDRLGAVGTDVINRSKDDVIANLKALRPTLQALADSGDDLVNALPLALTLPFPDGVEKGMQGGSLNLFLTVDMQLGSSLRALGVGEPDPVYRQPTHGNFSPNVDPSNPYYNGNGPRKGWPTVSLLPILPLLPPSLVPPPLGPPQAGAPIAGSAPAAGKPGAANPAQPAVPPPPANPLEGVLKQFGLGGGK